MSISQIARSIKESPTLKLNETAALLRERGDPVIHLGGGEPKSKAPMDAILACTAVLNTGEVRYTPPDGIRPLKKAIIRYMEENYDRKITPDELIISNGAKQAIMVALHSILELKDEVVFPAPYWVSYPEMVKLAGGVPVPVVPEDGSFEPTVAEMEENITSYTKAVMLNSPNNPSGHVYSDEFIRGMVELCEQKKLYLIMDDTYNRLVFDGREPTNCYEYAKVLDDSSRLLVVNCVSKMYAMTGFRIGWAVGNRNLIRTMINIQSQQTSGACTASQWAAVGALNGVQNSLKSLRQTLENNRNLMMEHLAAFDGIKTIKPGGTFYCFPDFSAYEKDSQKLANMLLEKVQVVVVPGVEFGMEGHIRLSYCGSVKDIIQGIERIKWVLDPNSPNELFIGERKLIRDWA